MYSKKAETDHLVASISFAESSGLNAGDSPVGIRTCHSSDNRLLSNSDLYQLLETERKEASHHLAILANSIFAAVGC